LNLRPPGPQGGDGGQPYPRFPDFIGVSRGRVDPSFAQFVALIVALLLREHASGSGARSASTRVAARPRGRELGALAGRHGSGRQQARRRLPRSRQRRAAGVADHDAGPSTVWRCAPVATRRANAVRRPARACRCLTAGIPGGNLGGFWIRRQAAVTATVPPSATKRSELRQLRAAHCVRGVPHRGGDPANAATALRLARPLSRRAVVGSWEARCGGKAAVSEGRTRSLATRMRPGGLSISAEARAARRMPSRGSRLRWGADDLRCRSLGGAAAGLSGRERPCRSRSRRRTLRRYV
jgi:hypothetical protein